MIEESFVRLYSHDFIQMAVKSELGQDIDASLQRRLTDARSHAVLMDARKGTGHLAALIARLRDEAGRFDGRTMLQGADPRQAAKRWLLFLSVVADMLAVPTMETADPLSGRRRRAAPLKHPARDLEMEAAHAD